MFAAVLAVWAALCFSSSAHAAQGVKIPAAPEGRVSDYAGVLAAADRAALEALLTSYEKTAQAGAPQIAAVILSSLHGDSVEDAALRFAERWKIGSTADDGVLLLFAVAERKIRIEVGYGAESRLTDALSARIIRELIAPRLHGGDYAGGLRAGVVAIHQALVEQPVSGSDPQSAGPDAREVSSDRGQGLWGLGMVLLFLVLVIGLRKVRGGSFLAGMLLHSIFFGGRRGGGGSSGFSGGGFSGGGGSF